MLNFVGAGGRVGTKDGAGGTLRDRVVNTPQNRINRAEEVGRHSGYIFGNKQFSLAD